MIILRVIGLVLGWAWSFPLHGAIGLILLLTVYFPKKIRFRRGYVQVVVRRNLIPAGLDRTGDGDYDDPEDFRTAGQTHGPFMFHSSERNWDDPDHVHHEETHVWQCMVLGGILHPLLYGISFGINRLRGMDFATAYQNIWQEKQAYRRQREFIERELQMKTARLRREATRPNLH